MTLGGFLSWCLMGGLVLGSVAGLAWRALGREPTPWPEEEWSDINRRWSCGAGKEKNHAA